MNPKQINQCHFARVHVVYLLPCCPAHPEELRYFLGTKGGEYQASLEEAKFIWRESHRISLEFAKDVLSVHKLSDDVFHLTSVGAKIEARDWIPPKPYFPVSATDKAIDRFCPVWNCWIAYTLGMLFYENPQPQIWALERVSSYIKDMSLIEKRVASGIPFMKIDHFALHYI